jgi:two-component system CheB/CheR fusion protein
MDGYEVARRLRRQPGGDSLMLVALSGYGQEEDVRRSRAAGFDVHLTKPVGLAVLEPLLASLKSPTLVALPRHESNV